MSAMFFLATSFNQPLASMNTSKVTNMDYMFYYAKSFNQDLSGWSVPAVTTHTSFASTAPIPAASYPAFRR
jgi:surface protein